MASESWGGKQQGKSAGVGRPDHPRNGRQICRCKVASLSQSEVFRYRVFDSEHGSTCGTIEKVFDTGSNFISDLTEHFQFFFVVAGRFCRVKERPVQ